MRLTINQKIAGSSPARINRILCGKDLDRLVWQALLLLLYFSIIFCTFNNLFWIFYTLYSVICHWKHSILGAIQRRVIGSNPKICSTYGKRQAGMLKT